MNVKISIIVPIYNVEKYLYKCIESICNQTYKNLEIILVNDGSKDSSRSICEKFKLRDERIVIIDKENGGLSEARNYGIKAATGDYIGLVDGDDFIHKSMYKELMSIILNCNADIAICGYKPFNNSEQIAEMSEEENNEEISSYGTELLLSTVEKGIDKVVAWNKLYKASLFNNITYPLHKINEDQFTTYRLLYNANKIAVTNKQLYFYRKMRVDSITSSYNIKRLSEIDALEERIQFFKDKNEEALFADSVLGWIYFNAMHYWNMKRYFPNEIEIINKLRHNIKNYSKYYKLDMKYFSLKRKCMLMLAWGIPYIYLLFVKSTMEEKQ